ncbi:MAG: class I SAM-dependent methyltransferase [Actinomycetes bacterium]
MSATFHTGAASHPGAASHTDASDANRDPRAPEDWPEGVAARLAEVVAPLCGGALPVRLRGWDGSAVGPLDAPTVVVRDPTALRRLLYRPGELGLAQGYVTGEIDVEGDLLDGFRRVWATARAQGASARPGPGVALRALRTVAALGGLGAPPAPPASQARLHGRLHSLRRDRDAIAHHYDLSNEFYALLLDEHMAYSCAYFTSDDPGYGLVDAQRDKLDLVCRKLGLHEAGPGHRHLDVGCGWGSLSLFAAREYGVSVVGVTISAEQKAFVEERVAEQGLGDRVEIRLQDYRDVTDGPYDTVSSIEMGEHVGEQNYPVFAAQLHRTLRPGGRALVQQMSRTTRPGGGPFIEAFIAPDMHMRPLGETVALLERAGLEVRDVHALREHYVRTVGAWYATFERNWDRVVQLVGEEVARVWRLYLVGGALAFQEGRMGVDQILMARPDPDGRVDLPPVRTH